MAAGDFTWFQQAQADIYNGVHDLTNDTLMIALVTASSTPAAGDTTPTWGDYSANEVSGTGYTPGGATIGNQDIAVAAGVLTFDGDAVAWTVNGAGFDNARWGILYNDDATSDEALGFIDLGGTVSQQAGDVTLTPNASGIATSTIV